MNKIKLTLLSAIFFALISVNANATNVGIIDVEKIVKESKAMRYIQRKISKQQSKYQKDVDKKQKKLAEEQKELEKKQNILSQKAFEKEKKKFDEKVDDLKTYVDRKQNSLKKASLDGMSQVNEEIKEIIEELSEEKGYEVIIPASQALFYKEELDISHEVLDRLNDKITKVKLRFN